MLEILNNIAVVGKKLRNKILFDMYDNIDYLGFLRNDNAKQMSLKQLVKSKTFHK